MFNLIAKFFDKLEDKVRIRLSHKSIIYAFIGGVCHVLFWRGIWHTGDIIQSHGGFLGWMFYEPITVIWTSAVLLLTGLFVATFIGERIIISGLKKEKKMTDKTEGEVRDEEIKLEKLERKIDSIVKDIATIKNELVKK